MGQRQKRGQSRGQSGPEAGGFWLLCPFLSTAAQSSVWSVSAGYCQLHPAIGKSTRGVVWRNGDGVDCRNKNGRAKWRRRQWVLVQVRGGTAQGARGGIGGGRPLGQGGSGVPRLGLSPSTVGQWDSGTGTVAVACRCRACKKPERNWRSSPAPASPLPSRDKPPAQFLDPRVSAESMDVCTKRPMPKPPVHKHTATNETIVPFLSRSHFFPLEFWTCSIGGVCSGDGVSFRSFRFSLESPPVRHPTLIDK